MKIIWSCLLMIGLLFLLPYCGKAVDLNKGLLETRDNLANKEEFLKSDAKLELIDPKLYPTPLFKIRAISSLNIDFQTDKESYQAGEEVNLKITVSNEGFKAPSGSSTQEARRYYIWSGGNFMLEVNRMSENVANGEVSVASGRVLDKNEITLLQNEKKDFNFSWRIPDNLKNGAYEIRIYPTSKNLLLKGDPLIYWSPYKAKILVEGQEGKEDKVYWDLGKIKLGDEELKLKDKANYLDSDKDYFLSVPLKNLGNEERRIYVVKRIQCFSNKFRGIEQNDEKVVIGPGEEKVINFPIKSEIIKEESQVAVYLSYYDKTQTSSLTNREYFDYPITSLGSEKLIVGFFVKGNANYFPVGMGLYTLKDSPGFNSGSMATMFYEVHRWDPLFFWSAEQRREKETNIKLDLTLLDRDGNVVSEIGYEGPSWDRTGQISKLVKFNKEYDYLKLVGVLSVSGKGELDRREIEYNIPPEYTQKNLLAWIKEIFSGKIFVYAVVGALLILIASVLTVIWVIKRKKATETNLQNPPTEHL